LTIAVEASILSSNCRIIVSGLSVTSFCVFFVQTKYDIDWRSADKSTFYDIQKYLKTKIVIVWLKCSTIRLSWLSVVKSTH